MTTYTRKPGALTPAQSWKRARILAKAANIATGQARTYISELKDNDTNEWLTYVDANKYLDNNPKFNDKFGKALIDGAQNSRNKMQASQQKRHPKSAQLRRPAAGDPTRPVRAGAPNQYQTEITPTLLTDLRQLEKTHGINETRAGIAFLDDLRDT